MNKSLTINSSTDVVAFLKQQHEQIKRLLMSVLAEEGSERQAAFLELRRLLAVHETAEEEIVHPAARRVESVGEAVVSARLREENAAKRTLIELEELDIDSAEFDVKFRKLRAAVLSHAESEETEEFDKLNGALNVDQLRRMRKAAQVAEAVSPTRPHAGMESAAANGLVGPFASLMDRARDAISGKL